MAYDERLGARIRGVLDGEADLVEKKMFGGVAFMLGGHMCCGIVKEDLMARVGPLAHEAALALPHARPMDFAGRPMVGMVYVAPDGVRTERSPAGSDAAWHSCGRSRRRRIREAGRGRWSPTSPERGRL